jgi:SAM-dependent methyltransferase
MTTPEEVTRQVKKLYEDEGWKMVGEVTYDADTSEDLREWAAPYVSACRLRVLRHLPPGGARLLDMASGPIQYPEYLRFSEAFDTRVCVDLSQRALDMAKSKLGTRGEYHVGDFMDLSIEPVDAAVSLHTIYHIHKDRQEAAVRKLIELTRPGGTIVVVYSNPAYLVSAILSPLRRLANVFTTAPKSGSTSDAIYFHRHPLSWWTRFANSGTVTIHPWRTFSTREQIALFPNSPFGARLFATLFVWEDRFPRLFVALGCYPIVVIRKTETVGA